MNYRVKVGDIKVTDAMRKEINKVLESGRYSEGPQVRAFEDELAEYLNVKYAVAVNSGTSALLAGLMAIKEADGWMDECNSVIVPGLTFAADAAAVIMAGLEPVFADVDAHTFGMRYKLVAALVDEDPSKYLAVIPVHLMGYNIAMGDYMKLTDDHGIAVFEDIAESQGAVDWDGHQKVYGRAGACSFYISHNIQAGELGAVVTDDAILAGRVRSFKAYGRGCMCRVCTRTCKRPPDPRFLHERIGLNLKANEWSAAIARCQIPHANAITEQRRHNFTLYTARLDEHRSWLQLPPWSATSSPFAYPLVVTKGGRADVMAELEAAGIETRPLFGCLPTQQPAFAAYKYVYEGKLPISEMVGRQGFYIGCHQYITEDDIEYVGSVFDKYAKEHP